MQNLKDILCYMDNNLIKRTVSQLAHDEFSVWQKVAISIVILF